MAVRDVVQAILRDWRIVRCAELERQAGALAAARTLAGVLLEERDEAQGRAERLGQSQQNTLDKLAACEKTLLSMRDLLADAREARQKAEADAGTARAALEASERGLAASQAALAERTVALESAQASIVAERARFSDFLAALPPSPPSPPPFAVAYVSMPVAVVRAAIEPILANYGFTDKPMPPDYDDTAYNLFHPMDIVPFCDYWRDNLMPPARGEESDCGDRAIAFKSDFHRWSGYRLTVGIVQVTADWALVNGGRWPHYICMAVAPDGTPWCVDPALLAQPEPYRKERVTVLRGIYY